MPAALGHVLTADNAQRVQASYILEGANGPCTAEADAIFNERDFRQDKSAMLWSRLQDLAAFLLLDHWRPTVVQLLLEHGAIRMLDHTSERLSGVWVDLSLASVQDAIGQRIHSGDLATQ